MSKNTLNAMVTRALADGRFRRELLYGDRRQALREFALSEDDVRALQRIKANSLEAFIGQAANLLQRRSAMVAPFAPRYASASYQASRVG